MKKIMFIAIMAMSTISMSAQKFALIDMEYIMNRLPAYVVANEQINQAAKACQAEIDSLGKEAQALYADYQSNAAKLTAEQKKTRQEAIMNKEKEAAELKKKYFGPEGEIIKKRNDLISPIQEHVYEAVKYISDLRGYSLVLDRASDSGIIFASPRIDISNEVLAKLGYSN